MTAALTACSGSTPPTSPPASSPATSPAASPAASPATSPTSAPVPQPVTIAVAGDIHFEGVLRDRLEDPATALAPATAALAAADVAVVNLETSIGAGGLPEPDKRYTFQAPAQAALAALAAGGID